MGCFPLKEEPKSTFAPSTPSEVPAVESKANRAYSPSGASDSGGEVRAAPGALSSGTARGLAAEPEGWGGGADCIWDHTGRVSGFSLRGLEPSAVTGVMRPASLRGSDEDLGSLGSDSGSRTVSVLSGHGDSGGGDGVVVPVTTEVKVELVVTAVTEVMAG